ncbi:hypothetical protein BCR36DRAFT_583020 [Piromyces finnis]|uniref:Uncharacterized protein n=1 Tax=Piromyces finnis TaxID=1754191 RepID=A0A1Y1VAT7_9FUNG|nr:hypothetical protein BCR36DRAFT_583020 [Piromyces finnis]|eukprot:ORX51473.1 hypothetical protein BCR36DRAFT_583020 [Piromyces finnis]
MKTSTRASPSKSRTSATKITKAPTRVSSRIAAKSMALKMEKNTRQEKSITKRNIRSPRSPTKSPKKNVKNELNQMKEEIDLKKKFELNESLRDNPLTCRINQNTFSLNKNENDLCKTQISFIERKVDCYPSLIRSIENSNNDLAIKALHHTEKIKF